MGGGLCSYKLESFLERRKLEAAYAINLSACSPIICGLTHALCLAALQPLIPLFSTAAGHLGNQAEVWGWNRIVLFFSAPHVFSMCTFAVTKPPGQELLSSEQFHRALRLPSPCQHLCRSGRKATGLNARRGECRIQTRDLSHYS